MTKSLHASAEQVAAASRAEIRLLDYDPWVTDVTFALTSVPSRVSLLRPVLGTLLTQTLPGIGIELHLPLNVRSSHLNWPALPEWLTSMRAVSIVWHREDPGPSLKYLGPLMVDGRADRDFIIISVDDDVLYPKELAQALLFPRADSPFDSAVRCTRGWKIHRSLRWERSSLIMPEAHQAVSVGVITGHGAFAFSTRVLGQTPVRCFDSVEDDVRMMDDVWISGCLSLTGVRKQLVPCMPRFRIKISSAIGGEREARNAAALRHFKGAWRSYEYLEDSDIRIS